MIASITEIEYNDVKFRHGTYCNLLGFLIIFSVPSNYYWLCYLTHEPLSRRLIAFESIKNDRHNLQNTILTTFNIKSYRMINENERRLDLEL